ncbi:hypothetical protein BsWGS_20650 [Bradybaena similaris]
MDSIWSHRGVPYKICIVSLCVGICPFLLGFSAPDWLWFSIGDNGTEVDGRFGLWELCLNYICTSNPITGNQLVNDWFLTVVICQSLALPFYIVALVLAGLQNFAPRRWLRRLHIQLLRQLLHRDSETPEDLAFISGFLSFLGIIIFMIMTSEEVSRGAYYSWGFAMAFTGATIPVLMGVLMCKTHAPTLPQHSQPSEPRVVHTLSPADNRRPVRRPTQRRDRQSRRQAT